MSKLHVHLPSLNNAKILKLFNLIHSSLFMCKYTILFLLFCNLHMTQSTFPYQVYKNSYRNRCIEIETETYVLHLASYYDEKDFLIFLIWHYRSVKYRNFCLGYSSLLLQKVFIIMNEEVSSHIFSHSLFSLVAEIPPCDCFTCSLLPCCQREYSISL